MLIFVKNWCSYENIQMHLFSVFFFFHVFLAISLLVFVQLLHPQACFKGFF